VHVRDTLVAGKLAELVFEHLRHARPQFECSNVCAPEIETAVLRTRARRHHAQPDGTSAASPQRDQDLARALEKAVDFAMAGAIARAHAEIALFIDDACASLLVAPIERERLMRIAFCTAALGESLKV
jgi:hypothetical protein